MFRTKSVEKIKTHFGSNKFLSRKSCRLWGYVGKYGAADHATDVV